MSLRTGVLLMTYGSPRSCSRPDLERYLTRIRGGRAPEAELVSEFQRRYGLIGGSPLVEITQRLAAETEQQLSRLLSEPIPVAAGMRFSEPSVDDAAAALARAGAGRLLGLVLSPQYSPLLMEGYPRSLQSAAELLGLASRTVGAWHLAPAFTEVLATRLVQALARFSPEERSQVAIVMTAHSMPRRVVDREPNYIDQLRKTAANVAAAAGLADGQWWFAYQSAGHTPEQWLKPDLMEVIPELGQQRFQHLLLLPVQFLADHLETLYDIDIAGQEQALASGFLTCNRVPAPNADPDLAVAIAGIVRDDLAAWDAAEARPVAAVWNRSA